MLLLVDLGYEYMDKLASLVDEFMDYKTVKIHDLSPEKMSGVKGLIISSAQMTVQMDTAKNYIDKLNVLKEFDIPVLGVGLGHHFLGLLFGAQVAYQPFRNDTETISIFFDDPLFDKLPEETAMVFKHSGTISIPPNFELLASSDSSINEAMRFKGSWIYGVQFLPELSGNHGRIIIANFISLSEKNSKSVE
jgi:GMP synthase (glutamine-hydrolysing)